MGGHLVHLFHWLHEETEKGGIAAAVGIVIGLIVGYNAKPIMHPSDVCLQLGIGRNPLGHCPDVFDGERVFFVLMFGVVFGLVAILAVWLVTGRKPAA